MKVKTKNYRIEKNCEHCNYNASAVFQLDGWGKNDWLCSDCFARELYNSEAKYNILTERDMKDLKHNSIMQEFIKWKN